MQENYRIMSVSINGFKWQKIVTARLLLHQLEQACSYLLLFWQRLFNICAIHITIIYISRRGNQQRWWKNMLTNWSTDQVIPITQFGLPRRPEKRIFLIILQFERWGKIILRFSGFLLWDSQYCLYCLMQPPINMQQEHHRISPPLLVILDYTKMDPI